MEQVDTDPTFRKSKAHKPHTTRGPAPRTAYLASRKHAKQIKGGAFGRSLDNGICDTLWKRVRKHKQSLPGYVNYTPTYAKAARARVRNEELTPQAEHKQQVPVPSYIQMATRAAMSVFMKKHGSRRGG